MNAHINNDLAHALVLTWHEFDLGPARDSPEFRDYEKVNAILEAVEADIKGPLADDLIASVDTLLGTTDDFLALWSIRRARAEAWKRAADHARDARLRAGLAVRRLRRLRRQPAAAPVGPAGLISVVHPSSASGLRSRRR